MHRYYHIALLCCAFALACASGDAPPAQEEATAAPAAQEHTPPEADFAEAFEGAAIGVRTYRVSGAIMSRRHAGSKNTIHIQLQNKKGATTEWKQLNSAPLKTGAKFSKSFTLKNIGGASLITLVRLKTNGKDGLLLKLVKVATGHESKKKVQKIHTRNFSGGKRFLMCRPEDPPDMPDGCTMTLAPAAKLGAHACKQCASVLPPAPHPLRSNFKPPARGTGKHRYSLRRKRSTSARVQYDGFTVYVDCTRNAAYRFEYMAYEDCGCHPRHHGFKIDPNRDRISRSCQQRNGRAYKKTEGVAFDRGHLVPANHLDHDEDAITQSNFMTNILPQAALMNRGSWLESEELVECLRDKEPVHVLGGAVWDSKDPRYNWFQRSHNVKNPSFFWKVVTVSQRHKEDNHRIAFWIPNNEVAKRGTIGKYVVSIKTLEDNLARFGQAQEFDIPSAEKAHLPRAAWNHIKGCDKSV